MECDIQRSKVHDLQAKSVADSGIAGWRGVSPLLPGYMHPGEKGEMASCSRGMALCEMLPLAEMNMLDFSWLVLKEIYHYSFLLYFSRGLKQMEVREGRLVARASAFDSLIQAKLFVCGAPAVVMTTWDHPEWAEEALQMVFSQGEAILTQI